MLGFRQGRSLACVCRGDGNNPTTMEAVDFYFHVVSQTSEWQLSSDADFRLSCHFETAMAAVFLALWTSLRRPDDTSQRVREGRSKKRLQRRSDRDSSCPIRSHFGSIMAFTSSEAEKKRGGGCVINYEFPREQIWMAVSCDNWRST